MKFKRNGIAERIDTVFARIDTNTKITKEFVVDFYHKYLENQNIPSDWGEKRRSVFFEREYFYTAVNLLKGKILKNNKNSTNIDEGFVYFLEHEQFGEYTKIGSCIDIEDRLSFYNVGCPFKQYKIKFYYFSSNKYEDEMFLHNHFRKSRTSGEWFSENKSRKGWNNLIRTLSDKLNKI